MHIVTRLVHRQLKSFRSILIRTLSTTMKSIEEELRETRASCAASPKDFAFNSKRIRILQEATNVSTTTSPHQGVAYWMSRDQRVQDNWAFIYAQKLALERNCPLYVFFCLVPKFLDATLRHYDFMLKGLREV